jgi:adenosine kinase
MKCDFDAFPEKFFKEVLSSSSIIFCNEGEQGEIQRSSDLMISESCLIRQQHKL